jgi:DNA-binding LacI/PurR family transcriptional regulator
MQLSPSQQIRRQLRQRILDGQFESSGTLPTIRSLAKSFNVSTKTVQKAIHALSEEGIIEAKRGTGLFIKSQAFKPGSGGLRIGLLHSQAPDYLSGEKYPKPIIDALTADMQAAGYTLVPCSLAKLDRLALEAELIKLKLGGLILFEVDADRVIFELLELRLPMLSIDHDCYRHGVSCVVFDNIFGTFETTKHLIELGHRHITCLKPLMVSKILNNNSLTPIEDERLKGYCVAMQQARLPLDIQEYSRRSPEATQEMLLKLLGRRPAPTAFVCNADGTAMTIITEVKKLGYRVPQDISVMGFGDFAMEFEPGKLIASSRVDYSDMGRVSARLFLDILAGKVTRAERKIIPTALILRDSSAPPPALSAAPAIPVPAATATVGAAAASVPALT